MVYTKLNIIFYWFYRLNLTKFGINPVIFGHRFKYLPPASNTFYNLDKLNVGDEFSVFWKLKEYKYKIREIKIIEPTDFSVLAPSQTKQITLVTCAPLFSAKQRLVVIGELI